MKRASLSLFRHKRTGDYVIENHALDREFGGRFAYGPFVYRNAQEFRGDCLRILIEQMRGFAGRFKEEKSEMETWPTARQAAFDRAHWHVGVEHDEDNSLITLDPMTPYKDGGFVGEPEDRIVVTLPCDSEEFVKALDEAFRRCATR